jgi:hypothetical protein
MSLPTDDEQEMLELVNRLRADPAAEVDNLIVNDNPLTGATPDITTALDYYGVNPVLFRQQMAAYSAVAPLAWNTTLDNTAAAHSALMIQDNSQSHQLPGEPDLGTRVAAAGYDYSSLGENIYAYGTSVLQADAGFIVDWGPGPGGMQSPAGHRENLLSAGFTEIGIDISSASGNGSGATVGPLVVTEDLGSRPDYTSQIVGVAFHDMLGDNFYAPGEGDAGVTVTAVGAAGTYTTTTWPSGGYELGAPQGTYTVTFSGGGLASSKSILATLGASNIEVDDNDMAGSGAVTLAIVAANANLAEAPSTTTPFTFTVLRGGATTGSTTVQWAVTGSGADPAGASAFTGDALPSGTIGFAPGQASQTITVDVAGSTVVGPNETFTVTLSGASSGASIVTATAQGTIINNNTSPSLAPVQAAYAAILRAAPTLTYAGQVAAQIDQGSLTLLQFEASLIGGEQIVWSTLPALVTIDAFYDATPSDTTLTSVAAGAGPLSTTYLHNLGYSDPNVWSILGSWWADDANSTFNARYGGLSDSAFIQRVYQDLFGFAPTSTNAANLLADIPGLASLLHSDTAGVHGGLYGYLLYVGQTYDIGRFATAADDFLRAAANGTVQYGPELTAQFPPGTAGANAALAADETNPIIVAGPDQVVGPGPGVNTIQFLTGSAHDPIVPQADSFVRVNGFDPNTDVLDLRTLLSGTRLQPGADIAALSRYVTIVDQGEDAQVRFDPSGQGGGGTVAVHAGLGNNPGLDGLIARRIVQVA